MKMNGDDMGEEKGGKMGYRSMNEGTERVRLDLGHDPFYLVITFGTVGNGATSPVGSSS